MTLDQLEPGREATISSISGDDAFRLRLLELGLVPGTVITRVGQAPLGDPLSYRVRRAVLCLRRAEATIVAVEAK